MNRISWSAVIVAEGTDRQSATLMAIEALLRSKGIAVYIPMQSEAPVVLRLDLAQLEKAS